MKREELKICSACTNPTNNKVALKVRYITNIDKLVEDCGLRVEVCRAGHEPYLIRRVTASCRFNNASCVYSGFSTFLHGHRCFASYLTRCPFLNVYKVPCHKFSAVGFS